MMNFLAGFFLGFLLCLVMARNYISRASNKRNEIRSLEAQNSRLINALRYSGARISFYKRMNRSHLKKIVNWQKNTEKIVDLLRNWDR